MHEAFQEIIKIISIFYFIVVKCYPKPKRQGARFQVFGQRIKFARRHNRAFYAKRVFQAWFSETLKRGEQK
jgi:hypothetical protein